MTQTLIDSRIDYHSVRSYRRPLPCVAAGLREAGRPALGGALRGGRPARSLGPLDRSLRRAAAALFLAQAGFLIESASAYRYLRCMRGMCILPRESRAAVTRSAGNFVGLCDGHTFCPMMR